MDVGMTDRMWNRIMRTLIDTGRPPHHAELARSLGVSVAESRTLLHALLRRIRSGGCTRRRTTSPRFRPLNGLPTQYRITRPRRAEVVRPVRVRGDVGDLALSGETVRIDAACLDCGDPADRRDARRSADVGRPAAPRRAPELRLRPLARPARAPLNGDESLPVGRARPSLGTVPRRSPRRDSSPCRSWWASSGRRRGSTCSTPTICRAGIPRRGAERREYLDAHRQGLAVLARHAGSERLAR